MTHDSTQVDSLTHDSSRLLESSDIVSIMRRCHYRKCLRKSYQNPQCQQGRSGKLTEWLMTQVYSLTHLMLLALCADAIIGNVQEKAIKSHNASNAEVVTCMTNWLKNLWLWWALRESMHSLVKKVGLMHVCVPWQIVSVTRVDLGPVDCI